VPAFAQPVRVGARHGRLHAAIGPPLPGNFAGRRPEAHGKSRKVRGTERGRFRHRRTDDGNAEEVGLKLEQRVVGRGAAVNPQLAERDT
jgi:hypothetical protein